MIIFKVKHSPTSDESVKFFEGLGVDIPAGFINGNETNVSYFKNKISHQTLISKRIDGVAKTKWGGVIEETIVIKEADVWC